MKWRLTYLLFAFSAVLAAQNKTAIDSVNSIPFEYKVNHAATIDGLFLKNAENAKRIGYQPGVAGSYSNLGLVYYYQGKYKLNKAYQLKAIGIYEAIGDREKLAHEYAEMGYMMKRRDMQKAQYYMQKAKSIAESEHLEYPLMGIYDNYGVLKEMQQQLDSALIFYGKSLSMKEKSRDSVGIPYSLNNIAGIYAMTGRFAQARPLYDRALQIREALKDDIGISETYASLGDLYFAQKNYPEAIKWHRKSLGIALQNHYLFAIQSMYKNLADSYEKLGNPAESLKNYKLHTQYKDSLLNKETNAKIAELEVRFETNKKEKLLLQTAAEVRQRRLQLIVLAVVSLFIAIVGVLVYRQQKLRNRQQAQEHELKTAIAQIEAQNQLQNQRLAISRDLHDNIGAQLTFIISSMDNLKYAFNLKNTKLDEKLQRISDFTKDTIVELRDTIWAMNHNAISFEDLRARILNFIEKAREAKGGIRFRFSIADDLDTVRLSSVWGMNIYRTIQEAVNNALKYADASEIAIEISREKNIVIAVADNGSGFDVSIVDPGNGIGNMRKRMADIGAGFSMVSAPGEGTKIRMQLDEMI